MTRRRARETVVPTLPCLTIARSPANDVRAIVDAFVSTPALVHILTDRSVLIREHRAELRAVLQQLSGRLAALIEQPTAERDDATRELPVAMSSAASSRTLASPQVSDADQPSARLAHPRRPARHAAATRAALVAPAAKASETAADWRGGPLLR